jgi:ABC-2 type transport system permease protein
MEMLDKLLATLIKDLLILWRDRAGLLVLFLMPAVLVVIITLVQNNIHKLMGEASASVILVDQDGGDLGSLIVEKMSGIELVLDINGEKIEYLQAKEIVAAGDYQAAFIIPAGTTKLLQARAEEGARAALSERVETEDSPLELEILFDPTVLGGFRFGLKNSLAMVVMEFEIREKMAALSRIIPEHLNREIKKEAGSFAGYIKVPPLKLNLKTDPILEIRSSSASRGGKEVIPTPVQHNVPAWALFGMFFIVVPMAGSLIKERQQETLSRLLTIPVPYPVILAGKTAAFMVICFCQFVLIIVIGKFLLPHLGVDAFRLSSDPGVVFVVVAAASLAATSYGIMLGTICRTYEQASMFGSISVVAASAVGGVMVPVYAMPEIMREISVISPIGWGLEAFLDIFVRGGGLSTVTGELMSLFIFAICTSLVAWLFFARRA